MRKLLKKVAGIVVAVAMMLAPMVAVLAPMMATGTAWALERVNDDGVGGGVADEIQDEKEPDRSPEGTSEVKPPETTILPNNWGIMDILEMILKVLVYGLGVAAVLGTIIAAIMYLTARDSEQQVAAAKKRLYEVVIGLVAWAVMYAILSWLIPGGLNF